jgi:hypothetical protein
MATFRTVKTDIMGMADKAIASTGDAFWKQESALALLPTRIAVIIMMLLFSGSASPYRQ